MEKQSLLNNVVANRRLVEELYAHEKITYEAKEYALNILYPADQWGLWISRLLLATGVALLLSGVVYFFAFNWAQITPFVKLASIQIAMVGCLLGAYFYFLKLNGQILLLAASVLTGVFMAVFGQIYQTGADAYQLFMMWSLLTLGWTIISNFAPQWIFWLVITNVFLILWWNQGALPERDMEYMIYVFLMILNGTALGLREYCVMDLGTTWMQSRWVRIFLITATLLPMLIPIVAFMIDPVTTTPSMVTATIIGCIGHGLIYAFYRYKARDIWSLSATILSVCIIVEVLGLKILLEIFKFNGVLLFMFLLMGLMTLAIFTFAAVYIRKVTDVFEASHV